MCMEENQVEEKIDVEKDIVKEEDDEKVSLDSLTDERLLECYQEVDSFLKLVEEEIKKTDVGDSDE